MISQKHSFIFLHEPKTGGNAIQTLLLPLSDDHMVIKDGQDSTNRFGIVGPITPRKHATLQDYADRLGSGLASYRIIITLRSPFERMVALYFSPHRWLGRAPFWDVDQFLELVQKSPSPASFSRLQGNCTRQTSF